MSSKQTYQKKKIKENYDTRQKKKKKKDSLHVQSVCDEPSFTNKILVLCI